MTNLLAVRGLKTVFSSHDGLVYAVRGVSFEIGAGETVALVGESGSGKSTVALSVTRLLPSNGHVVDGEIYLGETNLRAASPRALRKLRGSTLAIVFQDSMTALNPLLTVGRQISETLEMHLKLSRRAAMMRAQALLEEVGVPDPRRRLSQYPHQLSGGLRQRVALACALGANPQVLIADEPTTALDVTLQAQFLDLLRREQAERRMGVLVITHDLGVVASIADRILVMYAGRIVEEGSADAVFTQPRHPYTLGLLQSVPRLDGEIKKRLPTITGSPPALASLPPGCSFRPRCPFAFDRCATEDPALFETEQGHSAACFASLSSLSLRKFSPA
jgi:oligopeptide transport system ATP-binding protein